VAERIWLGQFNIVAGKVQEDGPFAASVTDRTVAESTADLYITLQPTRPDTDELCSGVVETVRRIFGRAQYSVTGNLLLALGKAHQQLREWNHASLAEHRIGVGVSCMVVAGDDAYIAQSGSGVAFCRRNGSVERLVPLEEDAQLPLGESEVVSPWFHLVKLAQGDSVLLLSGGFGARVDDRTIARCLELEPEAALPEIFRLARDERDCGAVLIGALDDLSADDKGPGESASAPPINGGGGSVSARIPAARPLNRPAGTEAPPQRGTPPRPDRGYRSPSPLGRNSYQFNRALHPDEGGGVVRVLGSEKPRPPNRGPAHALSTPQEVLAVGRMQQRPDIRVRNTPPDFRSSFHGFGGRRRVTPLVFGGLGVVALALMLWFGLPALADSGRSHRFETLVRSTQTELTTAQSEADLSKRRELLNQAVSNIDEARRLRPGDPQAQSEATSVSDALTVLDAVYNLPDVPTVADLSTVGLSPSSAVEVAAGDRLYVLDVSGGKVFAVSRDASVPPEVVFEDGSDVDGVHAVKAHHIAWQPPQDPGDDGTLLILDAGRHLFGLSRNDLRAIGLRGVEQWRGDTGMAVSGESLYILDAAAGLVWRYASSPSGFDSDPAPAVARADIRDASGISVVGGIFLTGQDSRIRRFLDGQEGQFKLAGIDKPPAAPRPPLYDPKTGLMYVADRGNNRIIVLEGDGRFKRQLVHTRLAGLRGAAVDSDQDRLVGVIGQSLVAIPLPK